MEPQQFIRLSDACLARVAVWLERFDPDEVDYTTTDGVVSLQFPDGVRYVLNRQSATSQMWFAAGARAFHYDWDAAASEWRDDRDRHALVDKLAEVVSKKLGRAVTLA